MHYLKFEGRKTQNQASDPTKIFGVAQQPSQKLVVRVQRELFVLH
jgi:hypothetical protein